MIPVAEALDHLFALVSPLATEDVPLTAAMDRVLARPVSARRDQPPFAASAMDGYALRSADARPGARLTVTGESAAGRRADIAPGPGEAIRIFTGAPVPPGADLVVIQEDVTRDRTIITLGPGAATAPGANIRPAGNDFRTGATLAAPRRLSPADIALAAAMGHARLPVTRAPDVALIATGDELIPPGEDPGPDQIPASNSYGLHALLTALGARPRLLPIARDDLASLDQAFAMARGADLIVTIGGASVGDHDLVARAAQAAGMEPTFHKVAMRPGKPLMAGRLRGTALLGLPGNPVSAMVCGHVFMAPMIQALLGLPPAPAPRRLAPLAIPLPANGPREHYLRARRGPDGVIPFSRQDSSLLTLLSEADCLLVQPPGDPARAAGTSVEIIELS
jgi:molybdopterin molybdotransferase